MKKIKIEYKYKVPIMAIAILTLVAIVAAIVPPPPVNQNIGVYDTTITQFDQSLCRNCHNSTVLGGVPTRHHTMVSVQTINPLTGAPFGCLDCHPVITGQLVLDRNCIDCHNGSAFWGNSAGANVPAAKPHHVDTSKDTLKIGQPAQNRTCNFCHGSFIANFNDGHYKPSYNTSFMITPYATFKATNPTTGKEWGGCNACHQPSSDVAPIIADNNITHHTEVRDATPGAQCSWCHVISPFFTTITDGGTTQTMTAAMEFRDSTTENLDYANGAVEPGTTNISISGTGCEKCHSVQSIHNIQYDYNNTNGKLGFGHIGNNWDCNGCHASWVAGAALLQGPIIPNLDRIDPPVLMAGVASTLTITGSNFVNDAYSSVVSVDGVEYNPTSITDSEIVVNIPALTAGVHQIQLVKEDVLSKLTTLTVVSNPTIASAELKNGLLTITGSGFGPQPTNAQQYVTIAHAGKIFYSQGINSWTDTQITAKADNTIATNQDQVTVITGTGEDSATISE